MRTILIITRKPSELKELSILDLEQPDRVEEVNKCIIGVLGGDKNYAEGYFTEEVILSLNNLRGHVIILHHHSEYNKLRDAYLKNEQLIILKEVNCATTENSGEVNALDRKYYDELRANKWDNFDAAWKHFSQIDPHEAALQQLHNILNGTQEFNVTSEKEHVLYDNEKETHRIALAKLRDELLTL